MKHSYVLFFLLIAITSCLSNSAQNAGHGSTIAALEYQKMLNEKKEVQLVDVRTAEEYGSGHLTNAINIDYNASDFQQKIDALDKSKPTMIYCLSGGRSAGAMKYMTSSGFNEVYNLEGGILKWKAANLPLAGQAGAQGQPQAAVWKGMTKEEYNQLISGDIPVVVDFNAVWCGPCKQMKPILEEISKEYEGKIKIVPIDVNQHESLAKSMYVNAIPLLIYHEHGKVVSNQDGPLDKEGLLKFMKLKK